MKIERWSPERDGPFSEAAIRRKLERLGYSVEAYRYPPGTRFDEHSHASTRSTGSFPASSGWKWAAERSSSRRAIFTTNIEDGIALADEALRLGFEKHYPEAWQRIQMRRQFMRDVLGIRLKPEVLPFSNIPGYLPPLLLSPGRVMVVNGGPR